MSRGPAARTLLIVVAAGCARASAVPSGSSQSAQDTVTAITHVDVVDVEHGSIVPDRTVLIVGHQIREDAGFTPAEALRSATLEPAQFFSSTDTLGTVAAGKVADLALLTANPLVSIRNTERIAAVIMRGHHFSRADLDSMLARTERRTSAP